MNRIKISFPQKLNFALFLRGLTGYHFFYDFFETTMKNISYLCRNIN